MGRRYRAAGEMADSSRPSNLPGTFMMASTAVAGFATARQRRCLALSGCDSAFGQSVSIAASSIIIASRFLASSNGRLVISAILRSR